jgi:hypothetical protein
MTKFIVFFTFLFLYTSLYASGPFTLTNLECANISLKNKTQIFNEQDEENIIELLTEAVQETKIKVNQEDCPSFRITLRAIDAKPNYYLHVKLDLREDVITDRKDNIRTFALTYSASDFTQSQEIHSDVLDSVQRLVDDLVKHFNDDNEK